MAPTGTRDPRFVRLADHVCHGTMVDVEGGSLWGLSGLEVAPFPNPDIFPDAAQYVRTKMRQGFIEEASEEEYTEQKQIGKQIRLNHAMTLEERLKSDEADVQEGQTSALVNELQRRIINRRLGEEVGPLRQMRQGAGAPGMGSRTEGEMPEGEGSDDGLTDEERADREQKQQEADEARKAEEERQQSEAQKTSQASKKAAGGGR